MATFTITGNYEDNVDDALGSEVLTDLQAIAAIINGGLLQANHDTTAQLLNATMHGNLGTGKLHNAADVHIVDAGNIITATDVEGALQENRTALDLAEANIATNTANIATNTAGIATNVANIATNVADIATNTAAIAEINSSGGAVNAKYGVIQKLGVTTTGLLTDFQAGTRQLFRIPTASGEIIHFQDYGDSTTIVSAMYGIQYDLSSDLAVVIQNGVNFPIGDGLTAKSWIYFDGILTFTLKPDSNGMAKAVTDANGGSTTVTTDPGLVTMTKTVTAAADRVIEFIVFGNANMQHIFNFMTEFLDDAKVSNIRPYRRY